MRTDYPAKVLIAWGEAIAGNTALRDWLMKNGYPELGIFTYALRLKKDARAWLLKEGHPHLMALIAGIEGDQGALKWLDHHKFGVLKQMAMAGDGEREAFDWLMTHGHKELAVVSMKMHKVKREIDDDHHDPHKFSQE